MSTWSERWVQWSGSVVLAFVLGLIGPGVGLARACSLVASSWSAPLAVEEGWLFPVPEHRDGGVVSWSLVAWSREGVLLGDRELRVPSLEGYPRVVAHAGDGDLWIAVSCPRATPLFDDNCGRLLRVTPGGRTLEAADPPEGAEMVADPMSRSGLGWIRAEETRATFWRWNDELKVEPESLLEVEIPSDLPTEGQRTWVRGSDGSAALVLEAAREVHLLRFDVRGRETWHRVLPRAGTYDGGERVEVGMGRIWGPVSMAGDGTLVVPQGALRSDCSLDRDPALLFFEPGDGELRAEVALEGMIDMLSTDGEQILVRGGPEVEVFDLHGVRRLAFDPEPREWKDEREARRRRANDLTATSPMRDLVELFPLVAPAKYDEVLGWIFDRWDEAETQVGADFLVQNAREIFARHPEGAKWQAITRFEASEGEEKVRWLEVLVRHAAGPVPEAMELVRLLASSSEPGDVRLADEAMRAWRIPPLVE